MEHLIPSFIRVIRHLDDAADLLALFNEFESKPSAVCAEDRVRLLDLPDPSTQEANIAAKTTLSKQDLLKKAAQSPRDLTKAEIDVLVNRFWGKILYQETFPYLDALGALENVSTEYCDETIQRLESFRSHLYEEYEAEALKNAEAEKSRRGGELAQRMRDANLEKTFKYGHPWLRQLWEEDKAEKPWGYALFINPQFHTQDPDRFESYDYKRGHLLHMAFSAISCFGPIHARWTLETLDWPPATSDNAPFLETVNKLRKHFNYLCSQPPKKQQPYLYMDLQAGKIKAIPDGITEGIQRNVFLYLDHNAASSVLDSRWAHDAWIWAIDPDYNPDNQGSDGYQGYLRIRLQQLIHNFFVARRWHADEFSMEDLWRAAQKEPWNKSFVSMKDEEIFAKDDSWEVVGALRARKDAGRDITRDRRD